MAVEAELTRLRAENARLLKLLRLTPQQAAPPGPAQGAFFEAAPGIVHHRSPQDAKVAFFGALFAARTCTRFGTTTRALGKAAGVLDYDPAACPVGP